VASVTRGCSVVACLCALTLACVCPVFAQSGLEYEVKAAFLYNFIQFVEWPPAALADPSSPFRVCVYGQDPFGTVLERTMRGEQRSGHPLTVEIVPIGESAMQCHLLFVPQSQAGRAAAALRTTGDAPILSIGESPNFLRAGGMINLFVEGGRVRFDINMSAASARGLVPSSKLLRVARNTSYGEP
jgi:uncharacterized protein DUF4154